MKNGKIIIVSLFLLLLLFPISVLAQTSSVERQFFGLILNPPIIEYDAKPGDVIKGSFTVTNDYKTIPNLVLFPIISDFESDNDNPGSPKWITYTDNNTPRVDSSMMDWINVKESKLEFSKTGEKKTVNFEIVVPTSVIAGTHQSAIIVSETEPTGNLSNAVGIISRIATLIFVNVQGDGTNKLSKNLTLDQFFLTDIDGNSQFMNVFEYLPANVNFQVTNNGNSNIAPIGDVFLNPSPGIESSSIVTINKEGSRVLRGSSRTFKESWEDSFLTIKKRELSDNASFIEKLFNSYYLEANWGKPIRLGRYVLQGKISYLDVNGSAVTKEGNLVLWIIPWKLILLILIFILAIVLLKKFLKRREFVIKRLKNGDYDEKYTKYIDN